MDDLTPEVAETSAEGIVLTHQIARRINIAFQQNDIPIIREISIESPYSEALDDLTLEISSYPPVIKPLRMAITQLRSQIPLSISPVLAKLDPEILGDLTEAIRGEITIALRRGDEVLVEERIAVDILSPQEWTGLTSAPELLAAFVGPNDPAVGTLLRRAAEKLRARGLDPSLDGYRTKDKQRVWLVAEAIWAALAESGIVYALPPASFERDGQKVRSPSALLERKLGTCLDLTLAYAACLEQAGLKPLLCLSKGHAYVGLWLKDDVFSAVVVDEPQTLRKRIALHDLVLIETTLLTRHPYVRFNFAVDQGAALVGEMPDKPFEMAVDVSRAREIGIRPVNFSQVTLPSGTQENPVASMDYVFGTTPELIDDISIHEEASAPQDRFDIWKRKLLDLSKRNKLLNFTVGKTGITLQCADADALEAKLAGDSKIKIIADPDIMSARDGRVDATQLATTGVGLRTAMWSEALARSEVYSIYGRNELEDRLLALYLAANSSMAEGGANNLFLAFGFVSWRANTTKDKSKAYRAPLLLIPARLVRSSVRSGFKLECLDEDARINPTLLEMLRQDFNLTIPEFEHDLPERGNGINIQQVWKIAKTRFRDESGFELVEEIVLATFSFVKFLMWKDLVERTDLLKRSPVVRHLIDTPKEVYGDGTAMPDARQLDREIDPKDMFMPLAADSSQVAAVLAAARGRDFVLQGPPGTGKSQTIANMIAHLLAIGKTVLFVSQKTTALEVVRQRLDKLDLGQFCLEVHSAKAQKTEVLKQLGKAWEGRARFSEPAWLQTTAELKSLREKLNHLVEALHSERRNGITAHQALARVVAGRQFIPGLRLAFPEFYHHDRAQLSQMRELCAEMATTLGMIGPIQNHPLAGIRHKDWTPQWQSDMKQAISSFVEVASQLKEHVGKVYQLFGMPISLDPGRILGLLKLCGYSLEPEASDGRFLLGEDLENFRLVLIDLRTASQARDALAAQFAENYDSSYLELDPAPLLKNWRDGQPTLETNDAALLRGPIEETFRQCHLLQAELQTMQARLSRPYRSGISALDLPALLNEWRDAESANFLVRSGKKKKVWSAFSIFVDDDAVDKMPEHLGRDIATLIEMTQVRAKLDPLMAKVSPIIAAIKPHARANMPAHPGEDLAQLLALRELASQADTLQLKLIPAGGALSQTLLDSPKAERLFGWVHATELAAGEAADNTLAAKTWITALRQLLIQKPQMFAPGQPDREILVTTTQCYNQFVQKQKSLVSVRKEVELHESDVIQERWPESGGGRRCGPARTEANMTAPSCVIPVT